MRMKQVPAFVLLLCVASPVVLAEAGEDKRQAAPSDVGGVQIIIRSESDRKQGQTTGLGEPANKGTTNSNRQSDLGSPKGPEQAQEPQSTQTEPHAQTSVQQDDGWYEYLFGKQQKEGQKPERDWYGYLFGKPRANGDDAGPDREAPEENQKRNDKDIQWWPFD